MVKHYKSIQEIKAEVVRQLHERLALINVDHDKYSLDDVENSEKQAVTVIYDGIKIMSVRPFISNVVENGKLQVSGMFSLRTVYDDYWYDNDDLDTDIFFARHTRMSDGKCCIRNHGISKMAVCGRRRWWNIRTT